MPGPTLLTPWSAYLLHHMFVRSDDGAAGLASRIHGYAWCSLARLGCESRHQRAGREAGRATRAEAAPALALLRSRDAASPYVADSTGLGELRRADARGVLFE